jgi:hypothetical protein
MLDTNFGEFRFRNCLENSLRRLNREFLVGQCDKSGAFHSLLPARGVLAWSLSGISKQFLNALG